MSVMDGFVKQVSFSLKWKNERVVDNDNGDNEN